MTGRAAAKSACDASQRAWHEIRERLEQHKSRINVELRNYPPPITACDQQFNYLLEQRASVESEISQITSSEAHCTGPDAVKVITKFLSASRWIDAAEARTILASADHSPTTPG